MATYIVKWIIEGEISVEADSVADAERIGQERLLATITNADRWPEDLGAKSIQGSASLEGAPASLS